MRARCTIECIAAAVVGCVAVGLSPWSLRAQTVAIAPQVFVIDARTRTAAITLMNQDDAPADVSFSTMYGYPVTDANGTMSLRTVETPGDTVPSAATWIQVYPRRMEMAPHSRRTVRLMVSPPANLRDGEYWARLVVAVKGGKVRVRSPDSSSVRIGLNIEIRSVLPVFYRKGALTTGVRLDHPRATISGDSIIARAALTRFGNSAFIGTLTATVRDGRGKVVRTGELPLGVYYTLDPRIVIPLAGLPRGTYRVTFNAESSRSDVERRLLVPGTPAHGETTVVVP